MGTADRLLRAIIGLGLVAWGVATHNWWGAAGVVLLLTALVRWCPAYCPLGINTCGRDKSGGCGCGGGTCG